MAISYTPNRNLALPDDGSPGATWSEAYRQNFTKIDSILKPLTLGSVVFADLNGYVSQDNAKLFWDNTNKRLGIGLNVPLAEEHILGSLVLERRSNVQAEASVVDFCRASATVGLVSLNDRLGTIVFAGHDGVAYRAAAAIRAEVDATPGVGDMGGRLVFLTTPDGHTMPEEAMRISNNKWVGIGAVEPEASLHVLTAAMVAREASDYDATPTLTLRRSKPSGGLLLGNDIAGLIEFTSLYGSNRLGSIRVEAQLNEGLAAGYGKMVFAVASGSSAANDLLYLTTHGYAGLGIEPQFSSPYGGLHLVGNTLRIDRSRTIGTGGDVGYTGEICYDDTNVYVKTSTVWKKLALQTI
ncbi:MAG: hypothetical protein QME66_04715 [Candidatus Eisenbacteria bacterium]|nr:hypothetical protein [Candidatus Eisenbacteria bacterium]